MSGQYYDRSESVPNTDQDADGHPTHTDRLIFRGGLALDLLVIGGVFDLAHTRLLRVFYFFLLLIKRSITWFLASSNISRINFSSSGLR